MTWTPELEELERRRAAAAEHGGPERVAGQRERGKLTARERIATLLDAGSFEEVGSVAGQGVYDDAGALVDFTPANVVAGTGAIDGRPVALAADDATVRHGGDAGQAKYAHAEQHANEYRVPMLRLVESVGGSVRVLEELGRTYIPVNPAWDWVVANLSKVPVVALALGPCAGLPAARVVASHYSLMVQDVAQVFAAGPPLLAQLGEQVTKEELGGARVHGRNGVVTDVVADEHEAFARTRRFLSYLPSWAGALPPVIPGDDPPDRADDVLRDAIPRNPRAAFKVRPIIEALVDRGSFFELGALHGRSLVTGLARLDGHPVALVANDPFQYGGAMTAAAARKYESFVDLASTFHLPVVNLVDQPGFAIGLEHETAGTMRAGVRALSAVYQTKVPWCSVILRRCFGVAGAGHRNPARSAYRYAWPSATWGSLRLEGGVQAAYRREIEEAPDPDAAREAITRRLAALASPFRTAEAFGVEELIDPVDTRARLCGFARAAYRTLDPTAGDVAFRG